jgi:hypothetical protein
LHFLRKLNKASRLAATEAREIASEMWLRIDTGVRESGVYGAESETVFKALLFEELRKLRVGRNELSLEPQRVYLNVDLAYCKGGLTWEHDKSEVCLVEVKQIAKQKRHDLPYSRNIDGIQEDVNNLWKARGWFPNSTLVAIAAFCDYDAKTYVSKFPIVKSGLRKTLRGRGVNVSGIELIVC